jgi:capsular polysaccharide export protein
VGVVTVNSTGGVAALELGKPTVALGCAIYGLPGLAHQGGLDRFWSAPEPPDAALFDGFKRTVIALTQVNGAFASRRGAALAAEGVAQRLLAS